MKNVKNEKNDRIKRKINYTNMTVAIIALVVLLVSGAFVGQQMYIKSKYPLEYTEEILKYSKEFDLDPVLVASDICKESKYRLKAKSGAGARGLMQIMPDTGEWIAGQLKTDYKLDDLYVADVNIRFGCWYLKYCLRKFNGQVNEALAAYNAGPANVNEWLADSRYSSNKKTLEQIPFAETKNYVETINAYYGKYKKYHSKDLI